MSTEGDPITLESTEWGPRDRGVPVGPPNFFCIFWVIFWGTSKIPEGPRKSPVILESPEGHPRSHPGSPTPGTTFGVLRGPSVPSGGLPDASRWSPKAPDAPRVPPKPASSQVGTAGLVCCFGVDRGVWVGVVHPYSDQKNAKIKVHSAHRKKFTMGLMLFWPKSNVNLISRKVTHRVAREIMMLRQI